MSAKLVDLFDLGRLLGLVVARTSLDMVYLALVTPLMRRGSLN